MYKIHYGIVNNAGFLKVQTSVMHGSWSKESSKDLACSQNETSKQKVQIRLRAQRDFTQLFVSVMDMVLYILQRCSEYWFVIYNISDCGIG